MLQLGRLTQILWDLVVRFPWARLTKYLLQFFQCCLTRLQILQVNHNTCLLCRSDSLDNKPPSWWQVCFQLGTLAWHNRQSHKLVFHLRSDMFYRGFYFSSCCLVYKSCLQKYRNLAFSMDVLFFSVKEMHMIVVTCRVYYNIPGNMLQNNYMLFYTCWHKLLNYIL